MRTITPSDRDRALRRLGRATSVALAAAGTLVAVFAGLAAKALPGRHAAQTTTASVRSASPHATPPPLVPVQNAAAPAAPPSPPAQSQAPPVVVSGGS